MKRLIKLKTALFFCFILFSVTLNVQAQNLDLGSLHAAEPTVFDITTYGAKSDGQTLNTTAIQKAIEACHAAGGGTVLVPSGVFVSGSLRLKSNVTLKIGKDAILRGSSQIADYAMETVELHWGGSWQFAASQWKQCLIYAEDAEQIGIEGPGTIDGQGGRERMVFPNANDSRRPMLVRLVGCRNVTIRNVKLLDPASFTTFFERSEDIHIDRVTIRSRNSPNGDGLNFDGCRRVRIKDCDIDSGDDGIAPKTFHPDWPNEDFEISGCHITSRWHAIRVGAESIGSIRRLSMRDCVFTNCQGGIKIESCEGALFEDLSFSGIEMKQVCQPFMVLASRFAFSAHGTTFPPPVGRIRNVKFSNIKAVSGVGADVGFLRKNGHEDPFERCLSAVVSLPGISIEEIYFSNIDLTFPGGGTAEMASRLDVGELHETSDYLKWAVPFDGELPASVLYLRHVKGVYLDNVKMSVQMPDARAFIAGNDVKGLSLVGVKCYSPLLTSGLIKIADVQMLTINRCLCGKGKMNNILVLPNEEEMKRLKVIESNYNLLKRD